jgi:putative peptidoglycan lipid II flippase
MFPLRHGGLALATSIASAVNIVILCFLLKKRIGRFLDREFCGSIAKTIVSSLTMWGGIVIVNYLLPWNNEALFNNRFLILASEIAVGLMTFLIFSCILKCSEMMTVLKIVKKSWAGK